LYVDYKNLPKVVSPGKLVYVDDGLISLEVLDIPSDDRVHVEVVNSGRYVSVSVSVCLLVTLCDDHAS